MWRNKRSPDIIPIYHDKFVTPRFVHLCSSLIGFFTSKYTLEVTGRELRLQLYCVENNVREFSRRNSHNDRWGAPPSYNEVENVCDNPSTGDAKVDTNFYQSLVISTFYRVSTQGVQKQLMKTKAKVNLTAAAAACWPKCTCCRYMGTIFRQHGFIPKYEVSTVSNDFCFAGRNTVGFT